MSDVPKCRICDISKWVAIWDEQKPEDAICMDCCAWSEEGHEFDRGTSLHVSSCVHCGAERDYDSNPTDGPVM